MLLFSSYGSIRKENIKAKLAEFVNNLFQENTETN